VHVAILPLAPASAGSLPPLPSPVVGGQLATDNGQWSSPAAPISGFTYSWESCDADGSGCVAIPDTNAPTFTPTPAELGRRLLVRVSASNLYGESAPQTALSPAVVSPSSAPTQPSTPQYTPAQRPRVSNPRKQPVAATPHIVGVPEPGKTLACRESVTNGRSDPWSYVWLRNGRRLRSARRPVHVVVARDVGTRLRCGVYQRGTAPVALRLSPPVAVVSPRLHRRGNVARPRRTRSAQRRRAAT
jgi:hypothetical protein